jgi:hypothetical protein
VLTSNRRQCVALQLARLETFSDVDPFESPDQHGDASRSVLCVLRNVIIPDVTDIHAGENSHTWREKKITFSMPSDVLEKLQFSKYIEGSILAV